MMPAIGLQSDHRPDEIPASHRDLAECPPVAALSTVTPGGYPQTSVVWCDFDGQCLRVTLPIPPSHLELLTRPICGVFTTLSHDGQPQSTMVWVGLGRGCALVNTTLERQKGRNLLENQKVSLLVVDPGNTSRFIQIRGDAELVRQGAREHLDALTRVYTGLPAYYGYIYPEAQRLRETRLICRIHPRRITLDAIHVADH